MKNQRLEKKNVEAFGGELNYASSFGEAKNEKRTKAAAK